MQRDLV